VAFQQPQYQYRSLFDEPEIKVTNASGETAKATKANRGVHPVTSYDQGLASATPSVMDSDEEAEMDDIKRAQNLSFTMTNVLETPEAHRAIRIIYRGDFTRIVQAAEEENHRLRKYLVATDLSDESTHALEWAIGTVLRDGDTLVAIYCIDEETGIAAAEVQVPDEPKAIKEQAAAINLMTNTKLVPAQTNLVSEFKRTSAFYLRSDSNAGTPTGSPAPLYRNDRFKAEQERSRAVQQITDKVLRLLRKTRLQVRVIVEVLHCKNPRHLVTEVIDVINPTLVVIGSRGRSALKGYVSCLSFISRRGGLANQRRSVILGSFSNYLVTKSSVPVMVARKKLRKQSKYKRTPVKQVNNISNPSAKSLANAKVD
jgi:nucleotide-binding universal stress UspA family protein